MRKTQIIPQVSTVLRPTCKNCGAQTWLVAIVPDEKADHDIRTFECPRCQDERVEVVKYR